MFPTQRRTVLVAVLTAFACSAIAQQSPAAGGKHHQLPATLETVQWGWLDPKEPPKLTVDSGDTISIETMMHGHDKVQPGTTIEQVVELRKANPGGGPHSMTGPIYVNGPVIECGPPPGLALRSSTTCSIVVPGCTLSWPCIMVSIEMVSPESTVSFGGSFGSSQPHCTVSSVAGSE